MDWTSDKVMKGYAVSESLGRMDFIETYQDDGYWLELSLQSKGIHYKQFRTKEVCEAGSYYLDKVENSDAFFKGSG
mgnify:CR=1 FL=1